MLVIEIGRDALYAFCSQSLSSRFAGVFGGRWERARGERAVSVKKERLDATSDV